MINIFLCFLNVPYFFLTVDPCLTRVYVKGEPSGLLLDIRSVLLIILSKGHPSWTLSLEVHEFFLKKFRPRGLFRSAKGVPFGHTILASSEKCTTECGHLHVLLPVP